MLNDPEKLIPVGKLISTHGIKGELKFYPYSGTCDSLSVSKEVVVVSTSGKKIETSVRRISSGGGKHIIGFKDYNSIEESQSLVGSEVHIKHSQLPHTDEDEYYWCDLIGSTVFTVEGLKLGTLTDIFETGSNDIYIVKNSIREYMIPAIADVIQSVDLKKKIITITPLDGLLDL